MLGKPLFATSDWHIGHEKAIEYDKRPFKNLDHMHESLITRYNATVPENGVCMFLGDMSNRPEEMRKVISRLNGTKILFLGNHDKGMGTMYNCGFDFVLWGGVMYIGDIRVTISHCPLLGVWREDTSNMGRRKKMTEQEKRNNPPENWHGETREKHRMSSMTDEGQFHLHGHIHSTDWKTQSQKILGKQFDVGVTANNYTPVSWSTIVSWVMKMSNKEFKDEG
jgi:calcineurin-like phosphoesterase family protein